MQLSEFILSLFKVILIENKEESLVRAQSRSAGLGLKNIGFIQANLDYFTGPFHVGVRIQYQVTLNMCFSTSFSVDSLQCGAHFSCLITDFQICE